GGPPQIRVARLPAPAVGANTTPQPPRGGPPRHTTPNGEVRLADVARLPIVDFTPGWAIRYAVDRAFRAAGVDRSTTFEVNDIVAAAELVRNDLGICIMPKSIAARFPDLPQYRFDRHAPNWKIMVVRPPGEAPPAVAALLRHIT
ncbi:LysR substrate-binding domain-containing protein, partial [Streptomyces sp. NPDC059153]|uniref:LysR substrate-binding domain-containing protein n=1 Tax=Streptomyces sp. NPDC059153 TaxID=3346743 RepID=UPI0036A56DBF